MSLEMIKNCPHCGGTHFGSTECPFKKKNLIRACRDCDWRTESQDRINCEKCGGSLVSAVTAEKNIKVSAPEIPQNFVEFAKAAAEIADANGIASFRMTFKPGFEQKMRNYDPRLHGEITIAFDAVDGRGRPCRNLAITLDAHLTLAIEKNPESFN